MANPFDQFDQTPQGGLVINMTPTPRATGVVSGANPFDQFDALPTESGSPVGKVVDAVNTGVNWFGTQATKAATGFAGTARALADTNKGTAEALGLPSWVGTAANYLNPITAAGQLSEHLTGRGAPSSAELNRIIFSSVAPEQNMPGPLGPAIDAGAQAAISTLVMPGSVVRNVLPAFTGGAAQELVGSAPGIKDTKLEPIVRLLTGVGVGGATALGQNAAGNVVQGIRNLFPNSEETAARLIGRAAIRDKTTIPEVVARQAELGPGAPLVEAGGPNMRGTLRGAITAPGEARTTAQELFEARRGQLGDTAASALDRNISPNRSVSTTVDELATQRRQASGPAYQAAGIPDRIVGTENPTSPVPVRPPADVPMSTLVGENGPVPLRLREAMPQPVKDLQGKPLGPLPEVSSQTFNTPNISSPAIDKFLTNPFVRKAINKAREFEDYKNLPDNSMAMIDKAYKNLGDLETAAKTTLGGQTERSRDLGNLRRDFKSAIVEANPKYGEALKAYSGPSGLIAATEQGKAWFKPGIDAKQVASEFQKLPAAEQEAARIGARDWARSAMERSDKNATGVALWSSPANRAKLQAILKPEEFADLDRQMGVVKNAATTATDINVGSRTAPMLAEQADNAGQAGLVDMLMGRTTSGALKIGGTAVGRLTQGKTEAVNAKLAEYLMATDPAKVGLVQSLAEKARQAELARQLGRSGALQSGVVAPAIVSGNRR